MLGIMSEQETKRVEHYEQLFGALDGADQARLYDLLLYTVRSNSGIGFKSSCQGHPDYEDGARGIVPPFSHQSTGQDLNGLYHMMQALSRLLADKHPQSQVQAKGYFVFTWKDFCRIAVEGHRRFNGVRPVRNLWEDGEPPPADS